MLDDMPDLEVERHCSLACSSPHGKLIIGVITA